VYRSYKDLRRSFRIDGFAKWDKAAVGEVRLVATKDLARNKESSSDLPDDNSGAVRLGSRELFSALALSSSSFREREQFYGSTLPTPVAEFRQKTWLLYSIGFTDVKQSRRNSLSSWVAKLQRRAKSARGQHSRSSYRSSNLSPKPELQAFFPRKSPGKNERHLWPL
jgi:hypothetical protein